MPSEAYLPSLLDRLADDSHVDNLRRQCANEVEVLRRKLRSTSQTSSAEKRKWERAFKHESARLENLKNQNGSLQAIKDCVKRDLEWLLSNTSLVIDGLDDNYPQVATSVLNYGMPDLTGKAASGLNEYELAKQIKQTIHAFEPRILKHTLKVSPYINESEFSQSALVFEIKGELWAEPDPLHLHLKTQLDIESGDVKILE